MSAEAVDQQRFWVKRRLWVRLLRQWVVRQGPAEKVATGNAADDAKKKIGVGVIGCGSVWGDTCRILRNVLTSKSSAFAISSRTGRARGKEFHVANQYPHIDAMLAAHRLICSSI